MAEATAWHADVDALAPLMLLPLLLLLHLLSFLLLLQD